MSRYWLDTQLVQFIRVWFVKPMGDISVPRPPSISYITFDPAKARKGSAREYKFETIHQMAQRYYSWLTQCGNTSFSFLAKPMFIPMAKERVQWSPLNKTTLGRGLSGFINRLVLLSDVSNFNSLRFQCMK